MYGTPLYTGIITYRIYRLSQMVRIFGTRCIFIEEKNIYCGVKLAIHEGNTAKSTHNSLTQETRK